MRADWCSTTRTIRTTRVEDVVAAVEVVEADEVVVADVDKAPDVVEAVVDMEKLIRALRVVRTLVASTNTPTEDTATDGANANAQFLLAQQDNLDNIENCSQSFVDVTDRCFQMLEQANCLSGNVRLIDSCSSVNLICNNDLLHDIVTVDWHMRVRCNARVRTTNQQGRLGSFPKPVWYNPQGVANILSLNSVKKYYRMTYDSTGGDTFVVTDATNSFTLHFKPTKNSLYALRGPSTDGQEKLSFVNTVSDNKDMYTKLEVKAAARARHFQNIIMFPGSRELMDISDQHFLKNNPVQCVDIKDAENIYGTNVGSLKGKTVTRKGLTVAGQITGVPPAIKQKYQNVTLYIDIMFVNKIPFLLTISRRLHFGTVCWKTKVLVDIFWRYS
jgi:hypothetical protein